MKSMVPLIQLKSILFISSVSFYSLTEKFACWKLKNSAWIHTHGNLVYQDIKVHSKSLPYTLKNSVSFKRLFESFLSLFNRGIFRVSRCFLEIVWPHLLPTCLIFILRILLFFSIKIHKNLWMKKTPTSFFLDMEI